MQDNHSQLSTEEKILEAAKIVFMESGLDNTRMKDIADKSGISRTTLNYYFRTKEHLFKKLMDQFFDSIVPEIENVIGQSPSLIDKIDPIIDIYYEKLDKNKGMPRFVITEIQRNPTIVYDFISQSAKVQQYIATIDNAIHSAMQAGEIRKLPLEQLLTVFAGLLYTPFLLEPILTEIWKQDESKRHVFFNAQKENAKIIFNHFLTLSCQAC